MRLDTKYLTMNTLDLFKDDVYNFCDSLNQEKDKDIMRIAIMLYDCLRKNNIDTIEKFNVIKQIVLIINEKETHNQQDMIAVDRLMLDHHMCWAMGDE